MDHIDLAYTRFLRQLPAERGTPRTLFLYRSGILEPPATEHGSSADENVAYNTAAYFADRELTGDGKVKRCKVLMLGNGGAGKTCLSLALTGRDPREAEKLGSTHAVQFWDWDFEADVEGSMTEAHLHLWDFGGQEIYHNTHRLFMSKGAVFLLLWNPDQDGQQPLAEDGEYQDEWRRLRYWLDFIHHACPHKPRVAIICSHHTAPTPQLENRWRAEVPKELADECRCFYIDSLAKEGQLYELEQWLQVEVGDVITTQGSAVPSYWEVAQNMVEGWVKRMGTDAAFAESHNQLHPDRFREYLWEEIVNAAGSADESPFPRLRQAIDSGEFELNEDRLRRTLGFLTRSGWIYWDAKLFEGRVIVGQKWALDGLYAVLERRRGSHTFRELCRQNRQFTLSDLGHLAWNEMGFSKDEQKLLLSYMQQCGLCFQLRRAQDAWREEDLYASFEHLPRAKEIQLIRSFDRRRRTLHAVEHTLEVPKLHQQHWQNLLVQAGMHYGKDAEYAVDGLLAENQDGQLILIRCELDPGGMEGAIEIQVAGDDAEGRLNEVRQLVQQFLPECGDSQPDPGAIESKRRFERGQLSILRRRMIASDDARSADVASQGGTESVD